MHKVKFLIVEDETVAAMEIQMEIEKIGGQITSIVHTEKNALNSVKQNKPDIILMDIKLGKNQNGIEIAKKIHETNNIPIFYITAFSDDRIMQEAFKTNPIGYIVKPFKPEDLKTNIQLAIYKLNLTEDVKTDQEHLYLGDGFYFDKLEKKLFFHNNLIRLGIKERNLLSILVNANYSMVHFSTLEELIWNGHTTSKSSLRTLIYRLKGKLGNNIIKVEYGYGYYLEPPS